MKKIILSLVFVCIGYASVEAQYDTISKNQISAKIQSLKKGTFKDSVFWSCIGLFDALKYNFISLYDYKIYVSKEGIYFAMSFKDKEGNISVSGVYFTPHVRKEIPENPPPDFVMVPNEHFCRCTTTTMGYAMIKKEGNNITCVGTIPEYDVDNNLNIACQDTEARQIFFRKYYTKGLAHKPKLKMKVPEILSFSE